MLFQYAGDHDIPLYVLIDEYDNFANTVLAYHGAEAYHSFTHGGGFFRNFFATLKGGADRSGGGIDRLFITGVSPVTMDDVTSGFNIGTNISLHPDFNEMVGFTETEVRRLVEIYPGVRRVRSGHRHRHGHHGPVVQRLPVLGGRPRPICTTPTWCSTTSSTRFPNRDVPTYLIDTNVRIDYGKLRHLLVVGRQPNGNFDVLRTIIGEPQVDVHVQPGFPLHELAEPENFLSLLHFFGLLRHPRGGAGRAAAGDPQPDREAADVRLPARRLQGRGRVQDQPVPVRAVADARWPTKASGGRCWSS